MLPRESSRHKEVLVMHTPSTLPSLLILTLLLLVPIGCDRDSAAFLEARPDGPLVTDGQFPAHSRVFDGRDSVATGIDGLVATQNNFAIVTQFIAVEGGDDVGRGGVTDPDNLDSSTPLLESRLGNRILAPNGDEVTWGEFSGAEGAIIVKCTRRGTHATVHLSGLICWQMYSYGVSPRSVFNRLAWLYAIKKVHRCCFNCSWAS